MPSSRYFIEPHWSRPANVKVLLTKAGGNQQPFGEFNLARHVGDDAAKVERNRARLRHEIMEQGGERSWISLRWLKQVHGTRVRDAQTLWCDGLEGDAVFSTKPGYVCAVLTADCLPVLICDADGTKVAAVHCGWRGLAAGIITKTIHQMNMPARRLSVYLGPAISQEHFEVGRDVLDVFLENAVTTHYAGSVEHAFKPAARPNKYFADLYHLASMELRGLGVNAIFGGDACTYSSDDFFSYRRSSTTGRMASMIWLT